MTHLTSCRATLPITSHIIPLLIFLTLFNYASACNNGNCKLLESCGAATDCASGLYCGNCAAENRNQPVCIRGQALIPTTIIGGKPFNKYSWLMTHNAFSNANEPPLPGVQRLTFYNQEDSVANQLRNGVRGLMLDMYDFENNIWLCHSFRGQCYNFTAFNPAIDTLKDVEAFLTENPSEIITIIIEDYVHTPNGLTKLFADAGLAKYWFPVSKMPKKGEDWPTVSEMVQDNHRLLVFTSDSSKEGTEGVAYQWRYMLENEPGDPGVVKGSCTNRKQSKPLNSRSSSMFLQNYFTTIPAEAQACQQNSAPLSEMVATCYKAAGNVMPTFVAINYYMRSDGGGVFDTLDRMNGHTLCGCSTITACQETASYGSCKNTTVTNPSLTSPTTPTAATGSFSGSVQEISGSPTIFHFFKHSSLILAQLLLIGYVLNSII
ncbi:hypothetical protein QQ045_025173 [Rhodiola kirilowii]